jgi:hypothetical protein
VPDDKKLGLAFSKTEVDEILHEGPLKPKHDGAFDIKKDYMDMSSSEDEEETPGKSPEDLYYKTEEKKV